MGASPSILSLRDSGTTATRPDQVPTSREERQSVRSAAAMRGARYPVTSEAYSSVPTDHRSQESKDEPSQDGQRAPRRDRQLDDVRVGALDELSSGVHRRERRDRAVLDLARDQLKKVLATSNHLEDLHVTPRHSA